jgi:hypothetical protein
MKRSDPLGQQPGCYYIVCKKIIFQTPDQIDAKQHQIGKKGVQLLLIDGTWHAFDWLNTEQYPTFESFQSETWEQGHIQRKAQKNLAWQRLSLKSHLFIISEISGKAHIIACGKINHIKHQGKAEKSVHQRIKKSGIGLKTL